MKRDMQIVRKLILYLETAPSGSKSEEWDLDVPDEVIKYHLQLMAEAGLIEITRTRGWTIFRRMTWAGHDFADAARDDVVWKKTWKNVSETTKSVTFELLNQLLKATLAKQFLD